MALNLVYPLKKGTYKRVRGFASHVRYNPGTWYGIDDGCRVGTPLIAAEAGRISHSVRQKTGGGWNFRLNFTKYKGWFMWYAHCSSIPGNGRVVKRGQVLGKSGATGGVSGPHLHFSLMQSFIPRNPDSKNVVQWGEVTDMYKDKSGIWNKTLSAERWNASAVQYYKNYRTLVTKTKSQTLKLKTLAGQIKILQKELKHTHMVMLLQKDKILELKEKVDAQYIDWTEIQKKVVALEEELKYCQANSGNPLDTKLPAWRITWGGIKEWWKNLGNKQ